MIAVSDRLEHVHSDIRGPLYEEALRMEAGGTNVLKLNTGNPGRFGFKLPNSVRQALALHIDEAVPYCDVRGMADAGNTDHAKAHNAPILKRRIISPPSLLHVLQLFARDEERLVGDPRDREHALGLRRDHERLGPLVCLVGVAGRQRKRDGAVGGGHGRFDRGSTVPTGNERSTVSGQHHENHDFDNGVGNEGNKL